MLIFYHRTNIPGEPGLDYPIHNIVQVSLKIIFIHFTLLTPLQETSFTCDGKEFGGYYADPEMDCQAYHICLMVGVADADQCWSKYHDSDGTIPSFLEMVEPVRAGKYGGLLV